MGAHAVSAARRGWRRADSSDPGASSHGGSDASQWGTAPVGATLLESRSALGREPSRRALRAVCAPFGTSLSRRSLSLISPSLDESESRYLSRIACRAHRISSVPRKTRILPRDRESECLYRLAQALESLLPLSLSHSTIFPLTLARVIRIDNRAGSESRRVRSYTAERAKCDLGISPHEFRYRAVFRIAIRFRDLSCARERRQCQCRFV